MKGDTPIFHLPAMIVGGKIKLRCHNHPVGAEVKIYETKWVDFESNTCGCETVGVPISSPQKRVFQTHPKRFSRLGGWMIFHGWTCGMRGEYVRNLFCLDPDVRTWKWMVGISHIPVGCFFMFFNISPEIGLLEVGWLVGWLEFRILSFWEFAYFQG